MDDFTTGLSLDEFSWEVTTDSIIRVDRYARELRSYIMYKPFDKQGDSEITSQKLKEFKKEMDRCEYWVDQNQWRLAGL